MVRAGMSLASGVNKSRRAAADNSLAADAGLRRRPLGLGLPPRRAMFLP
jgi:hypothetical protein